MLFGGMGMPPCRRMSLIDLSTRRPVAVCMMFVAVLLFGWVSLTRLPVNLLPDLSYPSLTVRTELPGGAPEEIETLLSKPIEEALGIIRNVRRVTSVARPGQSDVTLEFNWGTSMDYAVLDVREKLDALTLAKEASRPIVLRFDPSQEPVMRLGLAYQAGRAPADAGSALKRLRRVAEDQVQKPLEAQPGVAAVKISGGLEDEVQVLVDLQRLGQLNLTLEMLADRLRAENANISGGRVDQGNNRFLVRTLHEFRSLDQIGDTIVTQRDGRNLFVRDLAEVAAGHKEREAIIRIGGEEAVEIALYKEGDGNAVRVAEAVNRRLESLRKQIPADVELTTLYDQSLFIGQAIEGVRNAALLGGILAVLVLYLFLGSAWTTAVVAVAIPVSVIATFNLMYGAGLSLNIMSLGGIALAIGLLVDNAIVVLENIARKREGGLDVLDASRQGAHEVGGAITAATLTTVAVFFPMVFVQGIAGQLFSDQALVVSGALIVSLVVSLSLIPMLASRQARIKPIHPALELQGERRWRRGLSQARYHAFETGPTWFVRAFVWLFRGVGFVSGSIMRPAARAWRAGFAHLEARYVPLLDWALQHRAAVLGVAVGLFVFTLFLLPRIGVELIPPFNQGEFKAELTLAPGTPLTQTDAVLQRAQRAVADSPLLAAAYTVAGTGNRLDTNPETGGDHYGTLNLVLKPEAFGREAQLMAQLRPVLDDAPGLTYRYARPELLSFKNPLEIEVTGYDLDQIARVAAGLQQRMRASPRFVEVESTQTPGHPELQVVFDQERAAALGLNTCDLAQRVARAVQGTVVTRYRLGDREIDVLVRGREADRNTVAAVRNLVLNPESPRPVPLSAVARVTERSGPSEVRRVDGARAITLSANIAFGDLGGAVEELNTLIAQTAMPPGVNAQVAGQSEEMAVSFASLQFALLLAVFLVYLVMASKFESFVHPFVILFTIPLAGIGALLSLWLTGTAINVVVLIGAIVLAGIVVNNGIVLIDFINRLREEGRERHAAILEAGRARLRPILMTTLTTVLGLLPLALGGGEGAELRAPLAITVAGGLIVATALTLLVIPVMYSLLDRGARHAARTLEEESVAVGTP
jgi:hydrophobic/amphiphilic exporter-1 (mainly G- bacteria), HAE1 family